eukprot:m.137400 g.137400  ORF g.137400 m.137400 type:complete len:98 (+) comp16995_c0_seq4:1653-1946(+)
MLCCKTDPAQQLGSLKQAAGARFIGAHSLIRVNLEVHVLAAQHQSHELANRMTCRGAYGRLAVKRLTQESNLQIKARQAVEESSSAQHNQTNRVSLS